MADVCLTTQEAEDTIVEANNYSALLLNLKRFEEAKSLLRKTLPVARRVLEEGNNLRIRIRWNYARVLYEDDGATLDDLREAVTTLEDTERTARRVLGGTHPVTKGIGGHLQAAQSALRARESGAS